MCDDDSWPSEKSTKACNVFEKMMTDRITKPTNAVCAHAFGPRVSFNVTVVTTGASRVVDLKRIVHDRASRVAHPIALGSRASGSRDAHEAFPTVYLIPSASRVA